MVDGCLIAILWRDVPVSPRSTLPSSRLTKMGSYVAMHTMNDDDSNSILQDEAQANGYLEAGGARQARRGKDGRSPKMVMAAVGGMLLPLLTQIGHAH